MKTAADAAYNVRHHSTSLGQVIRVRDLANPVKSPLRRPGRGSQVGGDAEKRLSWRKAGENGMDSGGHGRHNGRCDTLRASMRVAGRQDKNPFSVGSGRKP